jgi:hypothetical protein
MLLQTIMRDALMYVRMYVVCMFVCFCRISLVLSDVCDPRIDWQGLSRRRHEVVECTLMYYSDALVMYVDTMQMQNSAIQDAQHTAI